MRRFFLSVFVLGLITWGLPASAQQDCFGPSCSVRGAGTPVPGCNAITAIANVVNGSFTCNPASVVNGTATTAGRSILTIRDTISGSSATSNFLNITGAFPATLSANANGAYVSVAADNDSWVQTGLYSTVTGTGPGSGAALGLWGEAAAASSAYNFGVAGSASGAGTTSVGVIGRAYAGTNRIGGYFALANQSPPATSAGIVVDNATQAVNIAEFRDNGTAVLTVADGGAITATQNVAISSGVSFVPGNNVNSLGGWQANTALTPDAQILFLGSLSTSLHFMETSDVGSFDYQNPCTTGLGTASCTDPTVIIHSHNQDTGEFLSMAHDGKAGVIVGGNSTVLNGTIRLGGTVTLTESSATSVLTIPVAVSTGTGGEIIYTVEAKDATNTQIRTGKILYAVANTSGGTETCNAFGVVTTQAAGGNTTNAANPTEVQDGSGVGAITSGTMTYAWSVDTTGSNQCILKLNAVSSLTQTTFQIHYTVIQSGPGVPVGG